MGRKVLQHIKSDVAESLPEPQTLEYGELAVNYAADVERLAIKNSDDSIVTFSSDTINNAYREKTELIVASALNDLEDRKAEKSNVYTKSEVDSMIEGVSVEVDDAISSTSENPVQNKVVYQTIADTELVLVAGINDLNAKKLDKTEAAATYLSSESDPTVPVHVKNITTNDILNWNGKQPSGTYFASAELDSATQEINFKDKDGVVIPQSTIDLSGFSVEIDETPTEDSENAVSSGGVHKAIHDNELVTAAALNDLNTKKLDKTEAASTYATKSEIPTVHELTQSEINEICV